MSPPIAKFQPSPAIQEDPREKRGSSFVHYSKQTNFYRSFGMRLKAAREAAGLSQEETARLAGLNRAYLSQIETGKRQVSLYLAYRLARALGSRLDSLLEVSDEDRDV